MLISYFIIAAFAFLSSLFLLFLFKKLSLRYNLLVSGGIPHIGGIAVGLAFILTSLLVFLALRFLPKEALGILIASSLLLVFGILDDLHELSIQAKFLLQLACACILVLFGVRTQIVYIGNTLNILITLVWVLGITNAFNHLDILDGLAGSTAATIAIAFLYLSILHPNPRVIILALTLSASILSFLFLNLPPAKIYLGNSGSHFLGFILGALAIGIGHATLERKIALLSPILILGLPIFDTAFLILMRLRKEKSIFKKSNDHLALRLLKKGHTKPRALAFMFLLCLFFVLSGMLLTKLPNPIGLVIVGLAAIVSLVVTKDMGRVVIDG
jgi:UDP-GlcNAc:undecaprenyl-phosphate GlcNAc-1-phosphate transferase